MNGSPPEVSNTVEQRGLETVTLKFHWLAALLIAFAVLICFHQLALHPFDVLIGPQSGGENDLTNYYIPSRVYFRNGLQEDHRINFWNPWLSCGTAYVGNPQSAVFYPPNWLTVLFSPEWSLSWLQLLHHWWMGLGLYVFCRQQQLSWGSCVTGGVSLACAPFLVAQGAEGHFAQIAASSWIPWAFVSFQSFLRSRSRRSQLCLAICLAMSFLCNHPQETYYLVLALSALVGFELITAFLRGQKDVSSQLCMGWISIGLLTIGLVAIDLVPIYFNSRTTPRGLSAVSPELMGWGAFSVNHFWQLVAPFSIDRPEIWERGTPPFWEKVGYFGIIPLALAITGVSFGCKVRWVARLSIVTAITFLIALGTNAFLFPLMLKFVPGTSWFRLPPRIFFLTSFCVAALAAYGLQFLQSGVGHRSGQTVTKLFAGLLWGLVLVCGLEPQLTHAQVTHDALLRDSLIFIPAIAGVVALVRVIKSGVPKSLFTSLLLLLSLTEFALFATQVTNTAVVRSLDQRNPELVETLQRLRDQGELTRILALQEIHSDLDAMELKLRKARGYDPAGSIFYLSLINAFSKSERHTLDPSGFTQPQLTSLHAPLLNAISISHVLQIQHPNYSKLPPNWQVIWEGELDKRVRPRPFKNAETYHIQLIRNPDALPRAFIVGNAIPIATSTSLNKTLEVIDFKSEVLLERDVLPAGVRATFQPVQVVVDLPDELQMEVELTAPGYLVVSDLWFPGWRATVNEVPAKILRGNLALRVIPLAAGRQTVSMKFKPPGYKLGLILTLLSIGYSLVQFRLPSSNTTKLTAEFKN